MKKFLILLVIALFLYSCGDDSIDKNQTFEEVPEINYNEYGLLADSLLEIRDKVKRNQTLTDLLVPHGVSYQKIHDIVQASDGIFDIRKIQSGKNYAVYVQPDSINWVKYFVYEESPLRYFVFDLTDSIKITNGEREVEIREAEVTAEINSSLYQTLQEMKLSPLLALKLSEVFAWQIDFYGIRAGDYFKVIYNEKYLDDKFMTVGKIKAAVFNHRGNDFYGIFFDDSSSADYYDEEGNSLRKAFLKAPLKFGRISSGYSNRRFHPVLKIYRPHRGIDYAAPTGTPVQTIGDGVVTERGYKRGNGNWVKIKHNSTYSSAYLHLSKFGKGIRQGATVRQGQVIGYVGSTGLSTGPHLDFRFYINGTAVNFLRQDFPPSKPVDKNYHEAYWKIMSEFKDRLDKLNLDEGNETSSDLASVQLEKHNN